MTTHENTPEVVESWEIPEEAKIVLNYPLSAEDAGELLKDIYTLIASQKQKQIEEIMGIAEGMKQEEHSHKVCENFSDCKMFTRHTRSHNQALDDLITKIQAKQ